MIKKNRVSIIAEVGVNHNGNFNLAKKLVKRLLLLDIDYIKFQICNPELVYSNQAFKANYQKKNDSSKSILEMSKKLQLSKNQHIKLFKFINKSNTGIKYCCSAFDLDSLKFLLKNTKIPFIKIPSGEIRSIDILKFLSKQKKNIIISTGMANFNEIKDAINLLKNNKLLLMHCVSSYPTPLKNLNMNILNTLKKKFKLPVGFSDHCIDNFGSLSAVSMGVSFLEKHVTMNNNFNGPDHKSSLNIKHFSEYVSQIRKMESVLGNFIKTKELKIEKNTKQVARKSIVLNKNKRLGEKIRWDDLSFKRPAIGIDPFNYKKILGKTLKKTLKKNNILKTKDLK